MNVEGLGFGTLYYLEQGTGFLVSSMGIELVRSSGRTCGHGVWAYSGNGERPHTTSLRRMLLWEFLLFAAWTVRGHDYGPAKALASMSRGDVLGGIIVCNSTGFLSLWFIMTRGK